MVKIDALLTKSLTFLRFILNLPPPPCSRIFRNIHPCHRCNSHIQGVAEKVTSSLLLQWPTGYIFSDTLYSSHFFQHSRVFNCCCKRSFGFCISPNQLVSNINIPKEATFLGHPVPLFLHPHTNPI